MGSDIGRGVLASLLVLAASGVQADSVGGLEAVRVAPAGHVALPALDETGCRVPMLVWRCHGGALALIWAFDMQIDPADAPALRFWAERDGAVLDRPAAWPLTASHRNAEVPAPVADALLAAVADGSEVRLRLSDPASGSELEDRFALEGVGAALGGLPCVPD